MSQIFFYFWALPTTMLGAPVLVASMLTGGRAQVVAGVLEVHGGAARWFLRHCTFLRGGASAMTLGHIVVGISPDILEATRTHERVHVRQAERWGPLFVPAYLLASAIAWGRGGDAYRDNVFEREAYGDI